MPPSTSRSDSWTAPPVRNVCVRFNKFAFLTHPLTFSLTHTHFLTHLPHSLPHSPSHSLFRCRREPGVSSVPRWADALPGPGPGLHGGDHRPCGHPQRPPGQQSALWAVGDCCLSPFRFLPCRADCFLVCRHCPPSRLAACRLAGIQGCAVQGDYPSRQGWPSHGPRRRLGASLVCPLVCLASMPTARPKDARRLLFVVRACRGHGAVNLAPLDLRAMHRQ